MAPRLFVVGLGFAGMEIAWHALARGWHVAGSVTSAEKARDLRTKGIDAEVLAPSSERLRAATHIVSTVPPGTTGDPVLPLLREVKPEWLGYLSTTGVYGDSGGAWVDETFEPRPGQARSRARLEAERHWQAWGAGRSAATDIFRLPAIYGPSRSALDQVRQGRAQCVDKPGQVFCRVHVADIAQAVLAAIERRTLRGDIFNVADDEPAPQADVIFYACELLGVPRPALVPWDEAAGRMSDMARSFYAENRRVRNDRLKRTLGVRLKYLSYREGLSAIYASERGEKSPI